MNTFYPYDFNFFQCFWITPEIHFLNETETSFGLAVNFLFLTYNCLFFS